MKSPARESVDLTSVTDTVLERLQPPESVTVRLELNAPLPRVLVDRHQAEQILLNLLVNAVQAMPDGGTLRVRAGHDTGEVVLEIEDTGVGIPVENLAKIFLPLFTTKAKGIGLGLALARDLAEANGARITVESRLGQGSRFTVRFERAPDAR